MLCRVRAAMSVGMMVAALAGAGPAKAGDSSPAIVIPGHPGAPVLLDGRDISGAVVEGDWGLDKPGLVYPTVIFPAGPQVIYGANNGYYPATGRTPAYGRREIVPPANRVLPRPAESFYREWGVQSDPVTASPPSANPTTVIVTPPSNDQRRRQPR